MVTKVTAAVVTITITTDSRKEVAMVVVVGRREEVQEEVTAYLDYFVDVWVCLQELLYRACY